MADKIITVRISRDGGNVKVDANGFTGEGCVEATRGLLEKMGGPVDTRHKQDFYVAEAQAIKETY